MNVFFEPFQYPFMRDALIVGIAISSMCAVLSCFMVLKGWALIGDAISHAVLPGIVIAYIVKVPLALGAFVAGLLCAFGSGFVKRNSRIREDTAMGVVFTGLFAIGLVLFSRTPSDLHLDHILVGNILGISRTQFWQSLGFSAVVLSIVLLSRRDLFLICFDRNQARVLALPDKFLHYLLLCLIALGIVIALQSVGIILVVAMLVTPACVAQLWTDRFDRMIVISVVTSIIATIVGILVSFQIDANSGGCIVLIQTVMFLISLGIAPKYGIISSRLNRRL